MHAIVLNGTLKRSAEHGVTVDDVRLADHVIESGVVSEAVSDADEWPVLHERILAAHIVIVATPTWLGQPSSLAERALERMDAGQAWTYWNQGPGPGEDVYLTASGEDREWTHSTGDAMAHVLVHTARALAASPIPKPPNA